jgi:hypothetical protein
MAGPATPTKEDNKNDRPTAAAASSSASNYVGLDQRWRTAHPMAPSESSNAAPMAIAPLHNYIGLGHRWEGRESFRRFGTSATRASTLGVGGSPFKGGVGPRDSTMAMAGERTPVDQSAAVDSFFSSIRIPASFLAATTFDELFVTVSVDDQGVQKFLQIAYLVFMGVSFMLSMNVIVLSTSALVGSLAENYDCLAETGYDLLFREFHYEFVCVQWSFMWSLFGFLVAVVVRILFEYELFHISSESFEWYQLQLGVAVCLIMTSLMLHSLSYLNTTLVGWNNMWAMTVDMLKMIAQSKRGSLSQPLEPISLMVLLVGFVFLLLASLP